MPILQVIKVSKEFPGVRALVDVDFELEAGEVHALLGANGAGKSTLMHIISGVHTPTSGEIRIEGEPVNIASPADAIRHGIGLVSQEGNLVPHFSVAENIMLGSEPGAFGIINVQAARRTARQLLQDFGVELDIDRPVNELSPAEQKLAEIQRVLYLKPRILILDEPTAYLDEKDSERLFRLIRRLKAEGIGIIFISHFLDEVFTIADRITILCDGRKVGTYPTSSLTQSEAVRLMINSDVPELYRRQRAKIGEPVLEVEGLSNAYLDDIHLTVRRGEIVGIAGIMGAGQTELAETIFGALQAHSGRITVAGKPMPLGSIQQAVAHGIYLVPDNRMAKALIGQETVQANLSLIHIDDVCRLNVIDRVQEEKLGREIIHDFGVHPPDLKMIVGHLSGGNKQKVSLGKWVFGQGRQKAKVYIFNEPTQGLDVGARTDVYRIIDGLVAEGAGVIFISSDLPELLTMSDRILVMRNGRIVEELSGPEATQERVLEAALAVESGGARHVQA